MNERIEELARQVGFNEYILENVWAHEQPEFNELMEKFAELIVRECIAQVRRDENGPAYEAVGRIARHFFRVEE